MTSEASESPRHDVTVLVLEAARFLGSHSDAAQDRGDDYCDDSESHNYAKSERRHLSEGNRITGLIFG